MRGSLTGVAVGLGARLFQDVRRGFCGLTQPEPAPGLGEIVLTVPKPSGWLGFAGKVREQSGHRLIDHFLAGVGVANGFIDHRLEQQAVVVVIVEDA